MRLIQCFRGPTSPSGMVFSAPASGLPKSRNTCSAVSRGMLPTRRMSCTLALRLRSATVAGASHALLALAQAPRDQPRQALGEAFRVARPLAVEHARLVEEQMRGVLLERILVRCRAPPAKRTRLWRGLISRIGLAADITRPEPCSSFSSERSGPCSGGDQTDRAVGQPVGGAHVRHRFAERRS